MTDDELSVEISGLKETPSTKIAWSYLLTKSLDEYRRALLTKNVGIMEDLLDYIESLIADELSIEGYYKKLERFKNEVVRSSIGANPVTKEEEAVVGKSVMMKVLKYRFKLIMKNIHSKGFTFNKYVDES